MQEAIVVESLHASAKHTLM